MTPRMGHDNPTNPGRGGVIHQSPRLYIFDSPRRRLPTPYTATLSSCVQKLSSDRHCAWSESVPFLYDATTSIIGLATDS